MPEDAGIRSAGISGPLQAPAWPSSASRRRPARLLPQASIAGCGHAGRRWAAGVRFPTGVPAERRT